MENNRQQREDKKYLVFSALYHQGIATLFALAKRRSFIAKDAGYPSTCNLCFHIHAFLAEKGYHELDADHYRENLKHY